MAFISAPDYYTKFNCIGSLCEDTCCRGWAVNIDRLTYEQYIGNTHPQLAPLFRLAVTKSGSSSSDVTYGQMKMKLDGACYFLQQDKLCAIQKNLGAKALSTTCSVYPRYLNQFGSQREGSLGVSCPEAARLILLNPNSMQFDMVASDANAADQTFTSYRFPLQNAGDPAQIAILNDFRAVIIAILQCRAMSVGARVMVLGFLLEDANRIVTADTFSHASELSPIFASFASLLGNASTLEEQFARIQPNIVRKLEIMVQMISGPLMAGATVRFNECLLAAAEGLGSTQVDNTGNGGDVISRYIQSYTDFYAPFFKDRQYIFENYLVNQVICRLFPFVRGSYLTLYRELVLNLSIIQVLLVGMAAEKKGMDETMVIQLFQSFARKSDHSQSYLDTLVAALGADAQDSFVEIMWLLKDAHA